ALRHLPVHPHRRERRRHRPRGDRVEDRRGAALLPNVARPLRGGSVGNDRQRLRRADHQGAAARVRRRDEPAHSAADGRLCGLIDARRVDFIAVPVSDLSGSDEFYGEVLGLMRNPDSSGERWVEYETGNLTIALSMYGGGIGLGASDLSEARGKLEDAGVEFGMDTFDSGVCHGAPFADPDGNRLLLHHRYAPPDTWEIEVNDVERTDFVGVNVRDRAAATAFYGGTLGLK